jgi:A/G-specific adenine glycosylase
MKQFIKDMAIASQWSEKSFQYLPWRKNRSFYHTLVSEVMLQQTTVTTVMNRFEMFIKKFPDLESLAVAKEADLLKLWQGLGYYNRAKRLQLAAKVLSEIDVANMHVENLLSVPGVGQYTANALLAIGLEKRAFAIDVNLERVLIRYFGYKHLPQEKKTVRENLQLWLEQEFKKGIKDFRALHETLMDVGRVYCQARKKNCFQCPLKQGCTSNKQNKDFHQELKDKDYSAAKKVKHEKNVVDLARVVVIKNKKILLVQRQKGQWLSGQWEVPTFVIKGIVPENQYLEKKVKLGKVQKVISSTITKYHFQNHVFFVNELKLDSTQLTNSKWCSIGDLPHLPLTSITHKIVQLIKKD